MLWSCLIEQEQILVGSVKTDRLDSTNALDKGLWGQSNQAYLFIIANYPSLFIELTLRQDVLYNNTANECQLAERSSISESLTNCKHRENQSRAREVDTKGESVRVAAF